MSDDLAVPDLPPKRIRHDGICERCNTECHRDPGGPWYNFYGRNQCKLDLAEGPHVVRDFTETDVEPRPVPAHAEVNLYYKDSDGKFQVLTQCAPEGTFWDETFGEPLTVTGWRIGVYPPKLA